MIDSTGAAKPQPNEEEKARKTDLHSSTLIRPFAGRKQSVQINDNQFS
jgi:hypothetical protein